MQAISTTGESVLNTKKLTHTAQAWVVTLTASLFFFYVFIQLNLFNAIDVQLMQAFQLNAPQLGQLSSMFFYANVLFLFPAGILLDRFSTKKILLVSVLFVTLGTFLFASAETYMLAAIGRFAVGIGGAFCFLSCIRIATRWFPSNQMALVTGVVVTMAMIGGLVAQTPLAMLSHAVGWRDAVLMDAGLGVVIFLAIFAFVKDYPLHSHDKYIADQAHLQSLGFWKSIRLVTLNPQNWYGGLYTALMNLPVFLLGALWGIHYLMQVHHVTLLQGSYATTLFFVGVILGSPFFGWISDRIGRRVLPMILGAVISLLVMLALLYVPELSFGALLFLFFLVGFVTSSQVLSYPTIAELNPTSLTSTAVSIISVVIMLSGVIFQPLFGWAMEFHWDHTMVDGAPVYAASDMLNAMLMMPAAFIVAFFIALLMKETFCKLQESKHHG
jgi:MFS family permease